MKRIRKWWSCVSCLALLPVLPAVTAHQCRLAWALLICTDAAALQNKRAGPSQGAPSRQGGPPRQRPPHRFQRQQQAADDGGGAQGGQHGCHLPRRIGIDEGDCGRAGKERAAILTGQDGREGHTQGRNRCRWRRHTSSPTANGDTNAPILPKLSEIPAAKLRALVG